jgi:L-alanine-DL-glutamate epimerase-like enolase superfamily enzyme
MAATTTRAGGARIDSVDVSAYSVPTSTDEESDGTFVWDSTTIVVVQLRCGSHTGLGYTYCDPTAGQIIERKLSSIIKQADPLMPQKAWSEMQMQIRQLGHGGIAPMAVSAVDVALWDLKAKLLGVCLADLPPRRPRPIGRRRADRDHGRCQRGQLAPGGGCCSTAPWIPATAG